MIKKMMCSAVMAATLLTPLTAMAERWVRVGSSAHSEYYYNADQVERYKALRGVWTKEVYDNGNPPVLLQVSISCYAWHYVATQMVVFDSNGNIDTNIKKITEKYQMESGSPMETVAKQVCSDYVRPSSNYPIPRP